MNIILALTDQERYTPQYDQENAWLSHVYSAELGARTWFQTHGIEFHRHYTASTACVPSRASLFLGQPLSSHHMSQTPGIFKTDDDIRIQWLKPDALTMGHHFRKLGYDTYYVGKWHLTADPTPEEVHHFGFDGWIGPEPHGVDLEKRGLVRDPVYVERAIELLNQRTSTRPFLLVLSLVNPHDIALYPRLAFLGQTYHRYDLNFHDAPESVYDLPHLVRQYRDRYKELFLPEWMHTWFHDDIQTIKNLYLEYMIEVDQHLMRFLTWFESSKYARRTWIVRTSDHGDMLGTKGLHQKWMVPYDEAIRVPMIISHVSMNANHPGYHGVTSHVDILPTLIGLAGGSVFPNTWHGHNLAPIVRRIFQTHPLPPVIYPRTVIFETEDDIFDGDQNYAIYIERMPSWLKKTLIYFIGRIPPMDHPKRIQTIITQLDHRRLYKLSRYASAGLEEWEGFDLLDDPNETVNIVHEINYKHIVDRLGEEWRIYFK